MPDFNAESPSLAITNPHAVGNPNREHQPYPRCVYKWGGVDEQGRAKFNELLTVGNELEQAAAVAAGWSLLPVAVAPAVGPVPTKTKKD